MARRTGAPRFIPPTADVPLGVSAVVVHLHSAIPHTACHRGLLECCPGPCRPPRHTCAASTPPRPVCRTGHARRQLWQALVHWPCSSGDRSGGGTHPKELPQRNGTGTSDGQHSSATQRSTEQPGAPWSTVKPMRRYASFVAR
jgi:hypothetical protein